MVFNSISFLGFFFLVFAGYWSLQAHWRIQNALLLIASYLFYGFWDWRFPVLMAATTGIDYLMTSLMRWSPKRRKAYLAVSLVSNLGVLFALKYFNFFQDNLVAALGQIGVEASPWFTGVFLPVGISFYTFQRLTFVLDVYREEAYQEVGFFDFALFVSFFPLLLSGPIERAKQLIPQLLRPRDWQTSHVEQGIWLITWGLFKKMFVADNLATLVDPVFQEGWHGSGGEALVAIYAYAFQIYCDFSGYSDVAIGLSKLLGFDVRWNFNLPYFATNPSDFWRRWHISLSTWLRDYVFIPMGGSRHGEWSTGRNLMATMVLVGLWHGAAWTFVVWGIYHAAALIVHRLIVPPHNQPKQSPWYVQGVSVVVMFHVTCLGWLLFRAESLQQAATLFLTMLGIVPFDDVALSRFGMLLGYVSILLVVQSMQALRQDLLILKGIPTPLKGVAYGVLFYLTVLHGGTSSSFIYFQF
jgi:alginate O-acetyltransferase complex protein AlgI